MPSRFPGMDPFIESQEWSDFHAAVIGVIRESLNAALPQRYVARVERRIYFAGEIESELFVETVLPRPECDYYAMAAASWRRSVNVYPWRLRDRLPTIGIPLRIREAEVPLDLQGMVETTYNRGRYDRSLDYRADVRPPLSSDDAIWCERIVAAGSARRDG